MNVQLRDISEIQPYQGNPRINDPAVNAVAASIREFGFYPWVCGLAIPGTSPTP